MARDNKDPDMLLIDPYRLSIRESQVKALKKFFHNAFIEEGSEQEVRALTDDDAAAIDKLVNQLQKM